MADLFPDNAERGRGDTHLPKNGSTVQRSGVTLEEYAAHKKTYAEHFEVLEGALEVLVGEETRRLGPGQRAAAERNTMHRFRNPTEEPTTFLVGLMPGHAGFEKAVKVVYGLANDGRVFSDGTPKNPYHLALILEWSEIRVPGILGFAEPLFRVLARRARRKGIDKRLEAEYCR